MNESKTYSAAGTSNSFYEAATYGGLTGFTGAKVDNTDQKKGVEDNGSPKFVVKAETTAVPKKQGSGILPHKRGSPTTRKSPSSRFGSPARKSLSPTRKLTASGKTTNTQRRTAVGAGLSPAAKRLATTNQALSNSPVQRKKSRLSPQRFAASPPKPKVVSPIGEASPGRSQSEREYSQDKIDGPLLSNDNRGNTGVTRVDRYGRDTSSSPSKTFSRYDQQSMMSTLDKKEDKMSMVHLLNNQNPGKPSTGNDVEV